MIHVYGKTNYVTAPQSQNRSLVKLEYIEISENLARWPQQKGEKILPIEHKPNYKSSKIGIYNEVYR